MTKLSVNLNRVALLRNSRDVGIPNLKEAAAICVDAGADGITVHPRPDLRHIRPDDVYMLAEMLELEFNVEGNPFAEASGGFPGFLSLVKDVKPTQVTLVPDAPDQATSDHGWDLEQDGARLRPLIAELRALNIRVSLFMDADADHMYLAKELGADRIELYTGPYAEVYGHDRLDVELEAYQLAAIAARRAGLGVNAGHDLNLDNLPTLLRAVGPVAEVSIGHALIADALKFGLAETVRKYQRTLANASA